MMRRILDEYSSKYRINTVTDLSAQEILDWLAIWKQYQYDINTYGCDVVDAFRDTYELAIHAHIVD
jgi:hypothetical protein